VARTRNLDPSRPVQLHRPFDRGCSRRLRGATILTRSSGGALSVRSGVIESHAANVEDRLSLRGKHRQRGKGTAPIKVSELITLYPGIITGNQYQSATPLAAHVSPLSDAELAPDAEQGDGNERG
jgi:hypothetical protein